MIRRLYRLACIVTAFKLIVIGLGNVSTGNGDLGIFLIAAGFVILGLLYPPFETVTNKYRVIWPENHNDHAR